MISRKDAFFGIHFDLHASEHDTELGADVTELMIARLLERVKPDYVQQDCKGHAGYTSYPTKVGWPSPGIVQDALAMWRKATLAHGVKLFIHYSGVWDRVAVEHHPEWARVTPEGTPDPQGITSTFGPYVDELLIPQLKEVFGTYNLDGAWIDGECWATQADYSPAALAAWQAATGLDDAPRSPDAPHWREWLEFNRQQFEAYLTHYLDALHAFNPALEITSNWMYTAFTPRPVKAPIDFISGDYSPQDSVNTARFEARYIASTGMPWDLMAWGFSWWGDGKHNHRSYKPAVQLQQEAAVVLAQGGGFQVYYQPTRAGWFDANLVETLGQVSDFCRARQAVSHKTETVPQVALLLSSTDFYAKTNGVLRAWEGEHNALQGTLHALLECGYSVDVLAEHQIADKLSVYPVIVLPEVTTLEPAFRDALVEYVRNGGSLLAIGAATARLFAAELDVELDGDPVERHDFIFSKMQEAGGKVPGTEILPPASCVIPGMLQGLWQPVRLKTGSILAYRYPTHDSRKNGEPAATLNTLKPPLRPDQDRFEWFRMPSGHIAAIYGPFGSVYREYHTPHLREFLRGVMQTLFPRPLVEVDGPPCIDVAVRKKDGKLLIHFLNTAGMQVGSAYTIIDFIPTSGPLTVRVRLETAPSSVSLVPADDEIAYTWADGVLVLTLPSLHIHNVVVIEP